MKRRCVLQPLFEMDPVLYQYTGDSQSFAAPATGWYKIECWGASGSGSYKGNGAYTAGVIRLIKGQVLYIYCGGNTTDINGSGIGGTWGGQGGGATDVRLVSGNWDNIESLKSRLMVASGASTGGEFYEASNIGPNAGGIVGYDSVSLDVSVIDGVYHNTGATQTSGGISKVRHQPGYDGKFGKGGNCYRNGSAGGGGYYGGAGGGANPVNPETGSTGSCFISGHNGCDAINAQGVHTGQPDHYSGMTFTETIMIDGSGYRWTNVKGHQLLMPIPTGGTYTAGTGHAGSGYCRISKA